MDPRPHPSGTTGTTTCQCGETWPVTLATLVEQERGEFDICPRCHPTWFQ